jgi:hypothetical protein
MSEANNCCGTTCDKSKLTEDIARVVAAFDGLDELERRYRLGERVGTDGALDALRDAIACLREKP